MYRQNSMFHVHTYRCGHMHDDKREWEYIEKAIELGAEEIWFTDHAPFPGDSFRNRMMIAELSEYVATLQELREQYASQIAVKIGLELEYLPNYHSYYEELRDSGNYDVLLLGQHFSLLSDGNYSFAEKDKSREARDLATGMIAGMKTGLFQVVAHPDQIFRRKEVWDEECEQIADEIKSCAAATGILLEKNVCNMIGEKKKSAYRSEFWKDLPDGVQIVYGLDAHSVAELEGNYFALRKFGRRI